jgi:hypothetical protein
MLTGFNNNVLYDNEMYHVQTENGGPENPVITTLVYLKGAIIASEKKSYRDILNQGNMESMVKQLMEDQHKGMIKGLLGGKFKK